MTMPLKILGTVSTVLVADALAPVNVDGYEKLGALGLLGIFMWFTLTRLEGAIRDNSVAVNKSSEATDRLIDAIQRNTKD